MKKKKLCSDCKEYCSSKVIKYLLRLMHEGFVMKYFLRLQGGLFNCHSWVWDKLLGEMFRFPNQGPLLFFLYILILLVFIIILTCYWLLVGRWNVQRPLARSPEIFVTDDILDVSFIVVGQNWIKLIVNISSNMQDAPDGKLNLFSQTPDDTT